MKTRLFTIFFVFLSTISVLGNGLSEPADSNALSIAHYFSDFKTSPFENYPNSEKEPSLLGSINLKWKTDARLSNEKLLIRYKYSNQNEWNYTSPFNSNLTNYRLDSIHENNFLLWSIGNGKEWTGVQQAHTIGVHAFENLTTHPGAEKVRLTWSINYRVAKELDSKGMMGIVSYNTDIRKKRSESGMEGNEWMQSEPFSLLDNEIELANLIGNETYHFKLGFIPNNQLNSDKLDSDEVVWSTTKKVKTERGWGILKMLILIGSLGFFIYGMKLMSEGLQQASGNMLRSMLRAITANRVKGVFTGFGITSLVQSSSVTTVMTVSFVNAGLLTLKQSAGVMMGANIGTTITAWIILIIGFKVSVGSYAFMLIAFAFPLLFIKKGRAKAWATAIVGFCILFIGLGALKDAVPSLDKDSAIVHFFLDFKDVWYGPVMFVFLGAFVTVVIQSSSAAMALTLAMVAKGAIPFEVACAMVLGENIGTTITAELASLIANVHAKRSARIHSMFNIVGVTWMLLIFPFFTEEIGNFLGWIGGETFDPANNEMAATGIALFHTTFNFANVLLLIWFVPQLVQLAERTVKSRGNSDEEFKLDFIGGPLGSTAELSILEAKKEVAKFGVLVARMNGFVKTIINTSSKKKKGELLSKLEKYEEITDRVEVEIANYLGRAAQLEMSDQTSIQMRRMLSVSNDLERVGDIYYQISKSLEKKEEEKMYFTPSQREGLNNMLSLVDEAFKIMNENLYADYNQVTIEKAAQVEEEINDYRNKLRKKHLKMIEKGGIHMQGTLMYSNIFSALEKVGDHIISVTDALVEEI